jgi:hypothetical protein
MADRDLAARFLLNAGRGVGRVVAAYRDEILDAEARQRLDDIRHLFGALGGVLPGGPDDGPSAHMDARDLAVSQVERVARIAFGQPLESVVHADHVETVLCRLKGDSADHAVDPRGRPTADHHCKLAHTRLPIVFDSSDFVIE